MGTLLPPHHRGSNHIANWFHSFLYITYSGENTFGTA